MGLDRTTISVIVKKFDTELINVFHKDHERGIKIEIYALVW